MSSVSFTIVKPYKNELVAKKKRQEKEKEKEKKKKNENLNIKKKKTKKTSIKRITPSWELLLECAIRGEQIGRLGIEIYGRYYSAKEIEERCRHFHPLPPFTLIKSSS